MTENEAKLLEKLDELANDTEVDMYSVANLNFFFEESANTIRNLIGEIQSYRAIGTVKEIKIREAQFKRLSEGYLNDLTLLRGYQSLGTVEEFKALKEKSVAKKPIERFTGSEWVCECPTCRGITETPQEQIIESIQYCAWCGQKLDWE